MSNTREQAAATPAAQRIDEFVLTHRAGDKEYRLWLQLTGSAGSAKRWHVGFAYGRIGTRLREGCKTRAPVTCLEAKDIVERAFDQKLRKGYALAITPPRAASAAEGPKPADEPSGTANTDTPLFTVNREGRRVLEF